MWRRDSRAPICDPFLTIQIGFDVAPEEARPILPRELVEPRIAGDHLPVDPLPQLALLLLLRMPEPEFRRSHGLAIRLPARLLARDQRRPERPHYLLSCFLVQRGPAPLADLRRASRGQPVPRLALLACLFVFLQPQSPPGNGFLDGSGPLEQKTG